MLLALMFYVSVYRRLYTFNKHKPFADGWAVTFGTARRGLGRDAALPSPLLAVPNVTANPSTASLPTSYY